MHKENASNGELAKELGRELIDAFGSLEAAFDQLCITAIDLGIKASQVSSGYVRADPKE